MPDNSKSTLILFTWSYPCGKLRESSFIKIELEYLLKQFDRIVIVPRKTEGYLQITDERIKVDQSFASINKVSCFNKLSFLLKSLTSVIFYNEVKNNLMLFKKKATLFRLFHFLGEAFLTKKWLLNYIKSNRIDINKTIFYTYWISGCTFGLSLLKHKYPDLTYISRAHGIDVYHERWPTNYQPLRNEIFDNINNVYLSSKHAKEYLVNNYPLNSNKFNIARLGIRPHGSNTSPSTDTIFRLISCSFMSPVKRLDLLINSLSVLNSRFPKQKLEWHHIGGGRCEKELKDLAAKELSTKIKYHFWGTLANSEILNIYKTEPFDLFAIVSESEGGVPVALQEAMSFGIPALGTTAGGISELIKNGENGFLLPRTPTPSEIANKIIEFIKLPEDKKEEYKRTAKESCTKLCNADVNFKAFSENLRGILD